MIGNAKQKTISTKDKVTMPTTVETNNTHSNAQTVSKEKEESIQLGDEVITVYTLILNKEGEAKDNDKLIRLPAPIKPYGLRIVLTSGSLPSLNGELNTNYPTDASNNFERTNFNKLNFIKGFESNAHCDILITRPGIYQYYISYHNELNELIKTKLGYFIIDPKLNINGNHLPLDGINLLSIVPKWLGPISKWDSHFKAASELGYNLIHFVPLQKRGGSNSPYSLFNQNALSDDLFPPKTTEDVKLNILKQTITGLREEKGLLSLIDMVWNHTSFDSEWLWDHPEAGYNLENSPHLRPAYELDTALLELSTQLKSHYNLKGSIENEADLNDVVSVIRNSVIPNLRLYEYYAIDVKKAIDELKNIAEERTIDENVEACIPNEDIRNFNNYDLGLKMVEHALVEQPGIRFGKHLKPELIIPILRVRLGYRSVYDNLEEASNVYHDLLNMINLPYYTAFDEDTAAMIQNIENHLRFQRLASNGPQYSQIDEHHPLLQTYFTRLPQNERTSKHSKHALAIANNGWVWAADPKVDFASPQSQAYLRRDVIIWGDCAKLRYGNSKEDNPWLWEHMRQYTITMAQVFNGFRIDNCHSTPIHLAEYLLDAARQANPDLYIVAELFTGSEEMDKQYVCQLGLNSLIREAMQAGDSFELSRLVHRYGGNPVGSLDESWRSKKGSFKSFNLSKEYECNLIPIEGKVTHSLFMDCTHDNESPTQKRTTIDSLPNAMLVGMTYCAVGSVKGYDEAYPKLLELVSEKRLYQTVSDATSVGIGKAKKEMLNLHYKLCKEGYNEIHVHHENQYVMVHRQHPKSHEGYLLIAHTAYKHSSETSYLSPVILRGTSIEFISSYKLDVNDSKEPEDKEFITGLNTVLKELEFPEVRHGKDDLGPYVELVLNENFKHGSTLLIKTKLNELNESITSQIGDQVEENVQDLTHLGLNILLYRCDAEEKDLIGDAAGSYEFPHVGHLAYCGLQGFVSALKPVMLSNNLGHPICQNLRDGRWALDYIINRLEQHLEIEPSLNKTHQWFIKQRELLEKVPSFLFPKYFSMLIFSAYNAAAKKAYSTMSEFVQQGDWFIKGLAMCSIQLSGEVKTTSLHPKEAGPCLAAGLPHFAVRHMRCWGRDTFISLKGLYLCTGNFELARQHLLSFAGSVKHGLVPNLLDSLRFPRYNARDATWWFLQALQDYCIMAPEGNAILKVQVPMRFPDGDNFVAYDDPLSYSVSKPLYDIIQDIFQRHAQGIKFREWNAGPNLDDHMSDKGFNVEVVLNKENGFIFGGSKYNCGTWMDKMGESVKAGTMGVPATPRDGAPVELTGLLKSALRWITNLSESNEYPYKQVNLEDKQAFTFKQWNELVLQNFEKYYYVPLQDEDQEAYHINPSLINRRGIYKDTLNSSIEYTDYRLRPNFPVAMYVAPELFDQKHAQQALKMAEDVLLAPLGMKTLDPKDLAYRGDYDNSNDSNDASIAKGFNYHQGPEWGWPLGYFLGSKLQFSLDNLNEEELIKLSTFIHSKLTGFKDVLRKEPYSGIPELTNSNGKFCPDSCPTQAWSAATALDLLSKLKQAFDENQKKKQLNVDIEVKNDIKNTNDVKAQPATTQAKVKVSPSNTKPTTNSNTPKHNRQQSLPTQNNQKERKPSTSSPNNNKVMASPVLTNKATKKVSASPAPIQTTPAIGKSGRLSRESSPLHSPKKTPSPTAGFNTRKSNSIDDKKSPLKPTFSSSSKQKKEVK
ncbi:hypothetical protein K502DRAFT_350213 [Neoconidiobolus thromboides FSU 785]|nr:hypothetical protein K502DRAFT_350213 [Neoconidiobolus thromboides FSU 785]